MQNSTILESFQKNVFTNRRDRKSMQIHLGERGLVQFETDNKPAEIIDFMFMALSPFLEIPG